MCSKSTVATAAKKKKNQVFHPSFQLLQIHSENDNTHEKTILCPILKYPINTTMETMHDC